MSDEAMRREAVWSFKVDRLEEQVEAYWKELILIGFSSVIETLASFIKRVRRGEGEIELVVW